MQEKKVHIELLRIISIYFVMFNHTQNCGFLYFVGRATDPLYFGYMFLAVLCRVAVPVFFMITGALLLKKEEPIQMVLKKRALKFGLILVGASLFYYILTCPDKSATDFLKKLYSTDITTGLWYLYSYLGILLMLPLLRKLVKNLTQREFLYMIVCQILLVGIIPMLEFAIWKGVVTQNPSFSAVILTTNNVFFVLLGYYCENILQIEKMDRKKTVGLIFAAVAAILLSCVMTHFVMCVKGTEDRVEAQRFLSSLISIPAGMIFILMRKLCAGGLPPKVEKLVVNVGGSVFGAYLLEKWIRMMTGYVYGALDQIIGQFWASLIWVGAGMTAGLILVTILRKMPVVGKYIRKVIG